MNRFGGHAALFRLLPLLVLTALQTVSSALGDDRPTPSGVKADSIDREPYRIELHLAADPSSRIDGSRRTRLLEQWQALVHRFVGAPWHVKIASPTSPLASRDLEALQEDDFAKFDPQFDKIWLIRIAQDESGASLEFSGREYDSATRRLGPLQRSKILVLDDAPRALLFFTRDLFNPTALIAGQEGGRALLNVRGAAITPSSELGRVVSKGTVFLPLRLVTQRDNSIRIMRVPFTYLSVEAVEGAVARCAIVSALRDPLTQRVSRPNTLAALGIKAGDSPLRLRFVTRSDQAPAAGYTLTGRSVPDGPPRELGMTDRSGRIVLPPGFAGSLVILRLLAGNVEPMVELPMMPGESTEERVIPFDPKPLTVALQVQLDALRDEVIDLVALRARLEARMKARFDGEDWAGLEAALQEYERLPHREPYAEQLAKLKEQAAHQQAQSKTAVLTKTVQAQFNDLQSLIDRYLDDDAFRAYDEALKNKKAELADKAGAESKRGSAKGGPSGRPAAPQPPPAERSKAAPAASDVPF